MNTQAQNIHTRSTVIRRTDGKTAFVAGLIWQPLDGFKRRTLDRQLREIAASFNCTKQVELSVRAQQYAGLLQEMPDHTTPSNNKLELYSLAAQVARKHPDGLVIVALALADEASDLWALVVVNEGVPEMDSIVTAHEVGGTIASYVSSVGAREPIILSNSRDLEDQFDLVMLEIDTLETSKESRLKPIPKDVLVLAAACLAVCGLLMGVFYVNAYLDQKAHEERMALLTNTAAQSDYRKAANQAISRLGVKGEAFRVQMNALMDYPFVIKGWLLDEIDCQQSRCKSLWSSAGGYTKEIVRELPNHQPLVNERNFKRIAFVFNQPVATAGLMALEQLPKHTDVKEFLYGEQQAWTNANLRFTLDLNGKSWPEGHPKVAESQKAKKMAVSVSGSLALMHDFIEQYDGLIYWDSLNMDVNSSSASQALTVTIEGAIYAR